MAARTGARTGLSPPALASDSSALDHSATEGTSGQDFTGPTVEPLLGRKPLFRWISNRDPIETLDGLMVSRSRFEPFEIQLNCFPWPLVDFGVLK